MQKAENDASCKMFSGIGRLSEKRLHSCLKYYFDLNPDNHEVKIGKNIVDVKNENGIYEIQTQSLQRLCGKLDKLLDNEKVNVVFPVPYKKYIAWISPEDGQVGSFRKSPKTGRYSDALFEVGKLRKYMFHENFNLILMLININEYRLLNGWSKDKKRGSVRIERVPTELIDSKTIDKREDFLILIPEGLPNQFTAKDFKKASRFGTYRSSLALNTLKELGFVKHINTVKRNYIYELTV